jgi:P-type conjugative transfer protein TrbG
MNGRGNVAAKAGWLLGAGRGSVAAKAGWLLGAWMVSAALMAAGAEPAAASGAAADTSGAAAAADTPGAGAAAADMPGTAVADSPGAAAAADTPGAGAAAADMLATAVAADVEREARAAAAGKEPAVLEHGDFVQVPFGRQVPVVRCAPLRVCLIELEEGELVLNTVTGDAARWILDRAAAGPRAATTVIVAKPTACNLTTNLVITTDRRIYQITLDARPCKSEEGENPHEPFTRLLRFYYPDELVRSWASAAAVRRRQGAAAEEAARSLTPLGGAAAPGGAGLPLASLHFNYRWTRTGKYPWTPAAVFDDQVHTYIRLPGSGVGQEAPVLFLIDRRGATALLNYAIRGQYYVTDRVFEKAALVIGSGKDQQRLEITRER